MDLEKFIREKLNQLEANQVYSIGTDSVRAWVDIFNEHQKLKATKTGWAVDVTNKKATHYYAGGASLCGRELDKPYFTNYDKSIEYTQVLGSTCSLCYKKLKKITNF